jgi:zinc protease
VHGQPTPSGARLPPEPEHGGFPVLSTSMRVAGRRGQWVLFVAAMLAAGCTSTDAGVFTSEVSPIAGVDDGAVPDDPEVRILTLSNGLTVYLRANDRPGGSAEMRLVINAGSGQEDPDQSATAHFLEHMLFNGTKQFPENQLIDTLRGFGMAFGADVNAYTSYDETVYELTVPTNDSENLGVGLDILREWLSAATLERDQVDKEKGVVLDEWRQRDQSFDGRVSVASEAMFLTGSGYEGRQPIGTDAAINAMTPELLRRYYDTWYRPDNAAIMVVGDIDVQELEDEVRDMFEGLTPRGESTPRTDPTLGAFGEPEAAVLIDPDATTGDVEVTLPGPFNVDGTVASLRLGTLISLAYDMITTRLNDDISRGLAPYTDATVSNNGVVRWLDAPSVMVSGEPDQLSASLDAVMTEFERVRRYGFADGELERVLRGYRTASQADLDAGDTIQDIEYISDYVDHFLTGTPIPDIDTSFQILNSLYDNATPEAVGSAFNELLDSAQLHVLVVGPDSLTDAPTRNDVLAQIRGLSELDINPREVVAEGAAILMSPPEPEVEVSSEELEGDGEFLIPTMLTFENGARVVLNPTDIADNDVYFSATSPGGLSLVDEVDVSNALNAVSVVTSSGIGDLDPVELDTVLSGAAVELYPSISQTSEDFDGSSTTGDLELLLQLVHLYMSAPRFDSVALESTVKSMQSYVDDPNSNPELAEYIAYSEARFGTEPRFRVIPTAEELAGLDLVTIERVWRERFTNPNDWVFALSGDFDMDVATDLVRRYFGTLDGASPTEDYKDFQRDPPATVVMKEVHAGTGDKGSLTFDWNASIPDTETDAVFADVLTSVLNIRLTDHIREELGASYSPSAYVGILTEPDRLVETYLNVTGDPATIPQISTFVIDDVTSLRTLGPRVDEFDNAIAELNNSYNYFDNQTIGDLLAKAPNDPELITHFKNRIDVLNDISPSALQTFISAVMPLDRYIEVRTVPA